MFGEKFSLYLGYYSEYFSPNTTRSIYNETNETKYAQKRQPMKAYNDQSSPIIDHESNNKINQIMKVIES